MLTPTPTTLNFNCNSPPFLIKIKRRAKNVSDNEIGRGFYKLRLEQGQQDPVTDCIENVWNVQVFNLCIDAYKKS